MMQLKVLARSSHQDSKYHLSTLRSRKRRSPSEGTLSEADGGGLLPPSGEHSKIDWRIDLDEHIQYKTI